ncbi:MAG: 16S rRNA (guanine(527)-N(7))-methyltransferase RsmG [Sulfuricellaceae bacterium]
MNLAEPLRAGLHALGLDELQACAPRLLDYLALLAKWNKVYNLTAVRELERMLPQHLLDSLAVLPYIKGASLLDVGSGAGLPGIPLAIALPELQVTLLDSNHKKTAFLRQACIELGLTNVTVICERVETWQAPHKFDIVISRAFSELATFTKLAGHLCAPGGEMLAMKGMFPDEEASLLPASVVMERIVPLKVPALEAERHLVVMRGKV